MTINDGTWALPWTKAKVEELKKILNTNYKTLNDLTNDIYGVVGDDKLFDWLYDAKDRNGNLNNESAKNYIKRRVYQFINLYEEDPSGFKDEPEEGVIEELKKIVFNDSVISKEMKEMYLKPFKNKMKDSFGVEFYVEGNLLEGHTETGFETYAEAEEYAEDQLAIISQNGMEEEIPLENITYNIFDEENEEIDLSELEAKEAAKEDYTHVVYLWPNAGYWLVPFYVKSDTEDTTSLIAEALAQAIEKGQKMFYFTEEELADLTEEEKDTYTYFDMSELGLPNVYLNEDGMHNVKIYKKDEDPYKDKFKDSKSKKDSLVGLSLGIGIQKASEAIANGVSVEEFIAEQLKEGYDEEFARGVYEIALEKSKKDAEAENADVEDSKVDLSKEDYSEEDFVDITEEELNNLEKQDEIAKYLDNGVMVELMPKELFKEVCENNDPLKFKYKEYDIKIEGLYYSTDGWMLYINGIRFHCPTIDSIYEKLEKVDENYESRLGEDERAEREAEKSRKRLEGLVEKLNAEPTLENVGKFEAELGFYSDIFKDAYGFRPRSEIGKIKGKFNQKAKELDRAFFDLDYSEQLKLMGYAN